MVSIGDVRLALCLLCLVYPQVFGGKIIFPEADFEVPVKKSKAAETRETADSSVVLPASESSDDLTPESRGLWESDLFFLQKLTGLFSSSEERSKPPSRQGGLRPEHLPPQLVLNKNRRQSIHINRQIPGRKPSSSKQKNVPYFQSPFRRYPQDASKPKDAMISPSKNNFIAVHLPPPPPPPPSHTVTVPSVQPASTFPYKYVRPNVASLQSPSNHLQPPLSVTSSRIDTQPQNLNIKPNPAKAIKTKKPLLFEPNLLGQFSITRTKSAIQPVQSPPNRLPMQKRPQSSGQPHPRPAPKPQKQHPRPPPQPQRIDAHAVKPTAIQKKPIFQDFNPSPQEGSMLADAFQPVFVASPNMDDLGNDIMKPMHIASARSLPTTTEKAPPVLQNFFDDF